MDTPIKTARLTRPQIFARVCPMLAEKSGKDTDWITGRTLLGPDLGIDSIGYTDLELDCEREFGITIEEEFSGVMDVDDLVALVERSPRQSSRPC